MTQSSKTKKSNTPKNRQGVKTGKPAGGKLAANVDALDSKTPTSPLMPTLKESKAIRANWLAWYMRHRRTLPWRSDEPVAYHVMVSEAMLQQTQVSTVISYFQRFIERFPTVEALAGAKEQEVLSLWQGLGYYRRARGLHAAAQMVVSEHDGVVPDSVEALLKLPGVGRYTAGAIASIAYNKPEPIVDGNVARVLARLFAIEQPTNEPAAAKRLWALAEQLVSAKSGQEGDFNQAMMELGAIVCTPRDPSCLVCPLAVSCKALERGLVGELPVKIVRRKPESVDHHVIAVLSRGQWYFEQRPEVGLWSNMWQLPAAQAIDFQHAKQEGQDDTGASVDGMTTQQVLTQWLNDTRRLKVAELTEVGSFTHQTTHRTITFTLWRTAIDGRRPATKEKVKGSTLSQEVAWRVLDDLKDLPMSNPQKRMIKMLTAKQCTLP